MSSKNDWILYAGAVVVGLYAVYTISKPLKDTAGGIATISQATGNSAANILTKTGTQTGNIIEGVGKTATNITDLAQAVSAAPLTIGQRINKAYEDIAPVDWVKDYLLKPLFVR